MAEAMRRICIITPGQIGSNPRVVKEADALYEAGYEVSVIATRMLDRVEPRDQALMRRIRWRLHRIDLRSRLRWRVMRATQIGARRLHGMAASSLLTDRALSAYVAPLRQAALASPADLYIAHYPAALPAAAAAADRHGTRYAYDAEDFHPGDWPDELSYEIERRLVDQIERRYLGACAHVTAASPGIADAYAETYGIKRPSVVLNAFPVSRGAPAPTAKGTAQPGPSLYWFSQTIGPNRGLGCAVRGIGLARTRPHLYLRGTLAPGYAEHLAAIARSAKVEDRVHILPPEEPDRMEELAMAYDAGLVAETEHTESRRLCLTNKLFTFLLAGIPPLMSDTPAHRRFASEAGIAELLYRREDAAGLADLLDRLFGAPQRLAASRDRAWRLAQERYNWEHEKGHLVDIVRQRGDLTIKAGASQGQPHAWPNAVLPREGVFSLRGSRGSSGNI